LGLYHVWKNNLADYILTLDDDVLPGENDPFNRYEIGFIGAPFSEYFSVGGMTSDYMQMRGFPYKDRVPAEVAIQYGGWSGVLDYDAATQLSFPRPADYKATFYDFVMPVPKGAAVTGCIMNCAFKLEFTPIMWQLTMLEGRYNRVGDIWSGLLLKRY
jgi:hypothetical protein